MARVVAVLAVAAVVLVGHGPGPVAAAAAGAGSPPLFKQCDPAWGTALMGVPGPGERATVCKEGCAMSSLAMALSGLGAQLPDSSPITPGSLNAFLVAESLYACAGGDCNNLVLRAPEVLGPQLAFVSEAPKPSAVDMHAMLSTHVMLAHVRNKTHFVLVVGGTADPLVFEVHDPFFNVTTYAYGDISDVILYSVGNHTTETPFPAPLYKQCDPRWANDKIETKTVCAVGCLMSSISMAIGSRSIPIDGKASTPGTLNAWLRDNDGYTAGNDLKESAVPKIDPQRIAWPADGMHTSPDLSRLTVMSFLARGRTVIANVMKGEHFVLVTGFQFGAPASEDLLLVNDPGFNRSVYSLAQDVVGWRIFDIE